MKRIYMFAEADLLEKFYKDRDVELFDFIITETDYLVVVVEKNKDTLIFDIDTDKETRTIKEEILDTLKLSKKNKYMLNISVVSIDPASFSSNQYLLEHSDIRKKNGEDFCEFLCLINELKSELEQKIKGQQYVINKVIGGLINSKTIANNRKSFPSACFTITGPSGVGKTYLTSIVSNFYTEKLNIPSKVFYKSN